MDKKSLKSVVVGYKLSGLSYADIASKLEEEYGIKMSRQAVNGLYKRATSDKEMEKNWNTVIKTTDICSYHALGYNVREIKELVQEDNFGLSIEKITEIISNNEEFIKDIEDSFINNIEKCIKNKESLDDIISKTKFKDVGVKTKKWGILLEAASKRYVSDKITEALADVVDITNDRDLVRALMKEYNVETTFREIGQKLKDRE